MTATVTDQNKVPVPGVRVDFVVKGANSANESVFAASNGTAQFCYTGTHTGEDTITGSVGLVSGSAQKTWIEEDQKAEPTQLATSLSGAGKTGETITVPEATTVSDTATLAGANAAGATGKVSYTVYSDNACSKEVASAGTVSVAGVAVPASSAQTLAPGFYYWQASYTGDSATKRR